MNLFIAKHPNTDGAAVWQLRPDGLSELIDRSLNVAFCGGKRLLVSFSSETPTFDLSAFAKAQDAVIMTDAAGDLALLQRRFDDGVQQVRPKPDPCDYRSLEWWLDATTEQRVSAVS